MRNRLEFSVKKQHGYSMIELGVVVVLLAVISSFFISKFDLNSGWGSNTSVRELSNNIEFLLQDASSRKVNYELEIYKNGSGYRIWQIARKTPNQSTNVDLLKNLRSKKQQDRRDQSNANKAQANFSEELTKDDQINNLPLNIQYYYQIFDDPTDSARRIAPLEYPSLVSGFNFPEEVTIKAIRTAQGTRTLNDDNSISISQNLTDTNSAILLEMDGEKVSLNIKPFERRVLINYGEASFE